jgi:hypothetical protein
MTTGAQLQKTLSKIEAGELYDIFNLLPDIASGPSWVGEIKDCAQSMADWLDADKDYDLDDLRDLGGQWSNSECEDYYNNINKRVQDLSLWASNDLDEEVQEINSGPEFPSLTTLNSQYLCSAMRQLWDAVADQAHQNTEESEEMGTDD